MLERHLELSEVRDLVRMEQLIAMLPTDNHEVPNGERRARDSVAAAAVICREVAIRQTQDVAPALLVTTDLIVSTKSEMEGTGSNNES